MRSPTAVHRTLILVIILVTGCRPSPKILGSSIQSSRGVRIQFFEPEDIIKSTSGSHHDNSGDRFLEEYENKAGRKVHVEFWIDPDMTLVVDAKKYGTVVPGDSVEIYYGKNVLVNGKARFVSDPKPTGSESRPSGPESPSPPG